MVCVRVSVRVPVCVERAVVRSGLHMIYLLPEIGFVIYTRHAQPVYHCWYGMTVLHRCT